MSFIPPLLSIDCLLLFHRASSSTYGTLEKAPVLSWLIQAPWIYPQTSSHCLPFPRTHLHSAISPATWKSVSTLYPGVQQLCSTGRDKDGASSRRTLLPCQFGSTNPQQLCISQVETKIEMLLGQSPVLQNHFLSSDFWIPVQGSTFFYQWFIIFIIIIINKFYSNLFIQKPNLDIMKPYPKDNLSCNESEIFPWCRFNTPAVKLQYVDLAGTLSARSVNPFRSPRMSCWWYSQLCSFGSYISPRHLDCSFINFKILAVLNMRIKIYSFSVFLQAVCW